MTENYENILILIKKPPATNRRQKLTYQGKCQDIISIDNCIISQIAPALQGVIFIPKNIFFIRSDII